MPRNVRLDLPGLLQHVMVRGIEQRDIFIDDEDRRLFLERFLRLLVDTGTKCYAWSLMSNHFHLLVVTSHCSLGHFMRRLLTGYAVTFNRRHGRVGHLFQNRYKSIVCEEETYLLELTRYIHLNPLRAGLVKSMNELDRYPWSGHAVLLGTGKKEGFATGEVLCRFGRNRTEARRRYREFVADGVSQGRRDDLTGGGLRRSQGSKGSAVAPESFDQRILGGGSFVDSLLEHEQLQDKLAKPWPLPDLIDLVGSKLSLPVDEILRPGKKRLPSAARGLVCYLAVRRLGYKGKDVGRELSLSGAGVSIAARRGETFLKSHKGLRQDILEELEK